MRDKICKAKRKDNKEWIEGYYFCMAHNDGRHVHHFIIPIDVDLSLGTPISKIQVEIDIDTLCDNTGLTDKNGQKIWENDMLSDDDMFSVVRWDEEEARFVIDDYGTKGCLMEYGFDECMGEYGVVDTYGFDDFCSMKSFEVIGNVFDNPELLKGGGAE